MTGIYYIYRHKILGIFLIICLLIPVSVVSVSAQIQTEVSTGKDSLYVIGTEGSIDVVDTTGVEVDRRDSVVFNPDPMKAVWLSALVPGLGQIYNRRYWKLPIVIGGFMGLTYAVSWNGRYYTDYSQAYRDVMDSDPTTDSYINFLPYNRRNDKEWIESNTEWLKSAMKRKKDFYRRNRDLCIISMIGVYVVAMIDAYVDAQLYHFDITPDVSMHLLPAVMEPTPFSSTSLGLQCAITF